MAVLVLKLVLTPLFIGLATLVGRRWGPGIGGWLVGLPLTSGPVALFLAIDHGRPFAASAASGSLVGAAAEAGFCLGYVVGSGHGLAAGLAGGTAGFVVASLVLLPAASLPLAFLLLLVAGVLLAALRLLPRMAGERAPVEPPAWDLPGRMIGGASIVVLLTTIAPGLGPHVSGVAAAFPVFAAVLAAFAHHVQGRAAALDVLVGLLVGLFAFAAFFVVVGVTIEPLDVAPAFGLAIAAALAVQAVSLRVVRRAGSTISRPDDAAAPPQGTSGRSEGRREDPTRISCRPAAASAGVPGRHRNPSKSH